MSSITLDGSGNVLIGGGVSPGYIARLDPTGTPDESFGNHGVVQNLGDSVVDLLTDKRNRVYALGASQLSRFGVDGTRDGSFSSGTDAQLLNGPGSSWSSMQFADSTQSSVYLMGGASCATACIKAATSAVMAKVILLTNLTGFVTTTALNASATTIESGGTVTFSAFVSGSEPTGSVTFKDGSTVLATENLTAASTSYSTSALAVGKHSITAVYSGDDHNAASSSQVVTETVNALPSGGGGGGNTGSGGGGAFAGLELCAMLLLWLWRAFVSRYLEFGRDPSSTVPVAVGKGPRALTAAGLAAGIVTSQTSSSVPSGDVISEGPAAGSVVAPGSAVDLVVSSGTGGGGGGGSSGGSGSFTVINLFLLLGAGLWCAWSNGRPADAPCGRRDVQRYSKLT
jgi:hypothetical protein